MDQKLNKNLEISQSSEDAISSCKKKARPESCARKLESVAFVTAGRLETQIRGLSSFIENAQAFKRDLEFTVLDDSKDPSIRNEYRRRLTDVKSKYGVNLRYGGMEEKEEFAGLLAAESGVKREIIDYCLFGGMGLKNYTTGANRNSHLLYSAGSLSFCADDDIICKSYSRGTNPKALALTDNGFPHPNWPIELISDESEYERRADSENKDYFAFHEAVVGKDLGSALKQFDEIDGSALGVSFVDNLRENNGRVVVGVTGIAGDAGMLTNRFLLSLKDKARQEWMATPECYNAMMKNRNLFRLQDKYYICENFTVQTMAFSIDHREVLPPFIPVFRSEDSNFFMMIRNCMPHACAAHIPLALRHNPPGKRSYRSFEEISIAHIRTRNSTILSQCAVKNSKDTSNNLRLFGERMKNMFDSKSGDFNGNIQRIFIESNQTVVEGLLALLETYNSSPSFWAQDVKKCIEAHSKVIADNVFVPPPEITDVYPDRKQASEIFRWSYEKYGELIEKWPVLFETAKHLNSKGTKIAKPL